MPFFPYKFGFKKLNYCGGDSFGFCSVKYSIPLWWFFTGIALHVNLRQTCKMQTILDPPLWTTDLFNGEGDALDSATFDLSKWRQLNKTRSTLKHSSTPQLKGLWALTVSWVVKTVHLLLDRRPHICRFSTFPPKITSLGWGLGVSLMFSSPDRLSSNCPSPYSHLLSQNHF